MAQFRKERGRMAVLIGPIPRQGRLWKRLGLAGGSLALGLSIALPAGEAFAQSAACRSIQAELANTGRADPRAAAQANRARMQVQRIAGYMASIGCDRQRILIFGSNPPPECPSLRGQLRQAQSDLAAAEAASGGDPGYAAQRRRDLQAALESYGCLGGAPDGAQPSRGPIENLFNGGQAPPPGYDGYGTQGYGYGVQDAPPNPDLLGPDETAPAEGDPGDRQASGGRPVCVRTCDGYFFPLDIGAGRARDSGDALCQALCPGAETSVYFMPPGGDIQSAVNAEGQNYTALPTALRYRQSLQPNCACKGQQESWATLLKPAEGLLGGGSSDDVTVTPEKSLELSRPTPTQPPRAADRTTAKPAARQARPDRRSVAKPPLTAGDQSQMRNLTVDGDTRRPAGVYPPILRGQN